MNGVGRFETSRGVVWKIRYYAPVVPGESWPRKQRTETLIGCRSRTDAAGVLALRMARVFDGTYRPDRAPPITVTAAIDAFEAARLSELRDGKSIVRSLRKHVGRHMGALYLPQVTTGRCEEYRRTRLGEGAKPATVRKELRYLQACFKQARKDGHDVGDPVADVSFKGINNARTRMPSRDELESLVDAARANETFVRPLFFVLVTTGMRISSALSLRWDRLDAAAFAVEQKGGTTVRAPMMDLLWSELARWRPESERLGKHGWVFPSLRGKNAKGHLSRSAVQRAWPALLERAKVEGVTRHDMRRWVVTALRALAGGDHKAIGQISGHASAAMIDRYDQGAFERSKVLTAGLRDLIPISGAATDAQGADPDAQESATSVPGEVPRNSE